MPQDVVCHEGLHEEVAVIIARLHPELTGLTPRHHGLRQGLGLEQVQELIFAALIDQHFAGISPFRHQDRGIMSAPGRPVLAQIGRKLFPAPVRLGRICNR